MTGLLECINLSLRYLDGTEALRSINLTVGINDFIAVIGQNGSGKTTLAKCLSGLLRPTEGSILLNGKPVSRARTNDLSPIVGYVFQNPDHQIFESSVWNEIAAGPRNRGLSSSEVDKSVRYAAERSSLPLDYLESHPLLLSKGMRQRVAFASILALGPQCLIIDEPTTGQDYRNAVEMMETVRSLWAEEHISVIVVTNDTRFAAPYAVRTIAMRAGRILADGPTGEVMYQNEILAQTMVEPPQATRMALALRGLKTDRFVLSLDDLKEQFPLQNNG